MLKNISSLGKILTKTKQKSILGGFGSSGGFCCEWCSDGTCLDYVDSPFTPCPFAAPCPN